MAENEQTHLPAEQQRHLARAKRLEWLSLGYTACTITLVAFVLGNSQAMKTAWVEDMLSTLPQISFLVAALFIRKASTLRHPYGYHRSMTVGHLVGSVALLVVGAILAYEAASGLVKQEHPSIGTLQLWGEHRVAGLAHGRCHGGDCHPADLPGPSQNQGRQGPTQ